MECSVSLAESRTRPTRRSSVVRAQTRSWTSSDGKLLSATIANERGTDPYSSSRTTAAPGRENDTVSAVKAGGRGAWV